MIFRVVKVVWWIVVSFLSIIRGGFFLIIVLVVCFNFCCRWFVEVRWCCESILVFGFFVSEFVYVVVVVIVEMGVFILIFFWCLVFDEFVIIIWF